jgi:two-component system OmpR family sensor kinase
VTFSTGALEGNGRFRVLVQNVELSSHVLVIAVPLADVQQTLRRLVLVEGFVTVVVLLGLGVLAWWLVRHDLRPLDDMAAAAGRIAGGDLSERVSPAESRTEVGRLGLALNSMLGRIELAFAERTASEERLRRFLADASHELRTPLTSIRGYAEMFQRGAKDDPDDLALAMRRIEDEGERMGVMVDELLMLARLGEGREPERRPVGLAELIDDAIQDARATDPERDISLVAQPGLIVLGDELQLRQVAANLIGNAIRHTPDNTPVHVRLEKDDGEALLEVADEGPGLSPEVAARAFEPFFRADPARTRATGGAGLGLAIVAAVIEAHGGTVDVASRPNHGATFSVRLPLTDSSSASGPKPPLSVTPVA